MAIKPNVSMTNFSGDTTSGWGSDEYGHSWTAHTPTGSTRIFKSSAAGVLRAVAGHGNVVARLNVPDRSDYEVLTLSEHDINTLQSHGPMIGLSTSTRGYGLRMTGQRVSIVALDSSRSSPNDYIEMNGVQISSQNSANRKIWMRLKYDSGAKQIRGKWWYHGTAEPSSWSISSYVGSHPISGKVGYYARDIGSYGFDVKVHAFYVIRAGASNVTSLPFNESFTGHRSGGWGRSNQGHVWLGHANQDPEYFRQTSGNAYASGDEGRLDASGSQERIFITDSPTQNGRFRSKFRVVSSNPSPLVFYGIRASMGASDGSLTVAGYELRIQLGSRNVIINKRTSLNGPVTRVGSFNAPFDINKGTSYFVEFQASGSQLAVKMWPSSSSEPQYHNYVVSDSSISVSGRQYLRAHPNGSSVANFYFDDVLVTTAVTAKLEPTEPPPPPPDPNVNKVRTGSVAVLGVTDESVLVRATYTGDGNNNGTITFQYKPRTSDTWSSVALSPEHYSRSGTTKQGERSISGLTYNTEYDLRVVYSDSDEVLGTNPVTATFSTTYAGITPAKIEVTSTEHTLRVFAPYVGDNDGNAAAVCTISNGSQIIVNNVPMLAARTQKHFELDVGGLDADTDYTVTVTFVDPSGVYGGLGTQIAVVPTLGRAVELQAVSVRTTMTTAVVTIQYEYDENENSEVGIQYRRKGTTLWTTLSPTSINVHRNEKMFIGQITGLSMNVGYDLAVTIEDIDGVSGEGTVYRSFSTLGVRTEASRGGKQHIYRVYDPDGNFVGSWPNGPDPSFSLDENGGVTNLSVTLPMTFSQIENDPTIDYMNRVDVWCIDGEALGMGRNLVTDPSFSEGSWIIPEPWSRSDDVGADGMSGLVLNEHQTTSMVMSETVEIDTPVPLVLSAHARAYRGKVRIDIEAFDSENNSLQVSDDNAETIGTNWQKLLLEWLPPPTTTYVRIRIEAVGLTGCSISHVSLLPKEMLVYRGTIEAYEPQMDTDGERINIDILGLQSYLTDGYVEFLQWVNIQPKKDLTAGRRKKDPTDPSKMVMDVIDLARKENPKFPIYYTPESIKMTGEVASYTLRDTLYRDALDKIRSISPPGWHWFVDQVGCLHFRGPEHVTTHRLTINVEVMEYRNPRTIRNMKNHIRFKGRQDSDMSEPDQYGTIVAEVMDTKSIAKYGKRTANFQDANITDPDTAMIYASGKLEELNQPEEAGVVKVPDEKDMRLSLQSLRGYNVQSFLPGDMAEIRDPENGPYKTYWDQFDWDEGVWDMTASKVVAMAVPIKSINYRGDHVVLQLSHRRPSANGDFAKLAQRMRAVESKQANGDY